MNCSQLIVACCAHSLGSRGDVGVRSTVTKSTSDRNPSGRASRSGRTSRKSSTMPPAVSTEMTLRMSRVRRAGNTFTRISVSELPMTAGITRNGMKTAIEMRGNQMPPS